MGKEYRLYKVGGINEGTEPGIAITKKVLSADKKENDASQKEISKRMGKYEKDSTSTMSGSTIEIPKTSSNSEYHSEMEIMNGMEMLRFDNRPTGSYSERAKMAIEGDPKMGNSSEWANVVAKGQGGDPDFGKNMVKRIKGSLAKRNAETPTTKMFGDDWEVTPNEKKSPIAISESDVVTEPSIEPAVCKIRPVGADRGVARLSEIKSEVNPKYTHFLIDKESGKILFGWEYKDLEPEDIAEYSKTDIKDMFGDRPKSTMRISSKKSLLSKSIDPMDVNNWEKSNNNVTESTRMKRLKFKNKFNGLENAIKMIPESYKIDNREFVMTDGNETYKIRWEGTMTEGQSIVLESENKMELDESIKKMKHLMGFKSQDTLGVLKGKERCDEDAKFMSFITEAKSSAKVND